MIDSATMHLLRFQGARMRVALHETYPPNRKEAAAIQCRVDDILDRRPRPISVTTDGEVLYSDASGWVLAQAPGLTTVVNQTGSPERVVPMDIVDVDHEARRARKVLGLGDDDGGLVGAR